MYLPIGMRSVRNSRLLNWRPTVCIDNGSPPSVKPMHAIGAEHPTR
jgi:hypothetical protein